MRTLYEEKIERGLSPGKLPLALAWTVPYDYQTDNLIGLDIITFSPVGLCQN